MIQIITEEVEMPDLYKRKFQKKCVNNKWIVINSETNSPIFKGKFENACLACYNLNKKYYKNKI